MSGKVSLPNHTTVCRGRIAVRSIFPLESTADLLVMVPGGPGISNQYLDPFLSHLDLNRSWNVALLDLPEHGKSPRDTNADAFEYSDVLKIISDAVDQLAKRRRRVVLWGHSFGGRLVLDLLGTAPKSLVGVILTATPYQFESSPAFRDRAGPMGLDFSRAETESEYAELWRKMIPLYFRRAPTQEDRTTLSADTCFLAVGSMLNGVGSLDHVRTPKNPDVEIPLLFLEGDHDIVVPSENLEHLRKLCPYGDFQIIRDAGHFLTLEAPEPTRSAIQSFIQQVAER